MAKLKTEVKSTKPNPDEEHLDALWQAESKNLERSLAEEVRISQRRRENTLPLLKAAGLSEGDVAKLTKEDKDLSERSLREAEQKLTMPPVAIDFETLQKQDLDLTRANDERMEGHNPSWCGFIYHPSYCGWKMAWNGEAEEVPNVACNTGANRFDPRAQAWGEGLCDADFSQIHAYLAFRFSPPSWGHLHIYTYPWLHGYYSLYSNDEWYNCEYARATVDCWVDVHQNYWRSRHYHRCFTMAGDELHPARSGRIDRQCRNHFYTNVGEKDTVTIRVGVRLYCYARANGGRALLNFQAGAANYVYVPYVHWCLHH